MRKGKFLKITGLILLVLSFTIVGKYLYDLSFKGDDNVKLISDGEKVITLEELIANDDFKDNVLYIDIWGTSCAPCIQEFKFVPAIKERYKDKQVKFIYLSAPYGHFYDERKWKYMIKKYNLTGFNMLMSTDFYNSIWTYEGIRNPFMIPHYILVDRKGKIIEINAARPSNKGELCNQIDKLL
jgi:thiol-disulfide isomerase/thioredoxin